MPVQTRIVDIPAGVDSGTEIPITTIEGAESGPTLALVAGNHGYEYPPILALQKLAAEINPGTLRGKVVIAHVANMPSFLGRTVYFSPVDGKNLNRVYPGRADGTVSERIAHAITKEVIEGCDALLDLHCGDGNESLRPYVYECITGNADLDARIARLVRAFGIEYAVADRGRPTDPAKSMYCSTTAITRGKPAVTVESGYLGTTDPHCVAQLCHGVYGVMRELGMTETGPEKLTEITYLDPAEVLLSPETGIIYPRVERDQMVLKGDVIAHITDFFGKVVAEVQSPLDGLVLYVVTTPPMVKGQPVACVGAPRKSA